MNKSDLVKVIRWIHSQGWSPATSTNYSFRHPEHQDRLFISRSGIDKSEFTEEDLIEMNLKGGLMPDYAHEKSSAETGIHLSLYKKTDANFILHTHSVADTVLSRKFTGKGELLLGNYEVLKGLQGITTHEANVSVPIFPNTQDMDEFCTWLEKYMDLVEQGENAHSAGFHGFLIESHGFYTWGTTLKEAKRHLEVFQFLFSCELELLKLK